MNKTSYLGSKGYTIHKNELTIEEQKQIRNDLTIKPFVMGSINDSQKTYPVYRESSNKFYLPHYYGVDKFGSPGSLKIPEGETIELEFAGKLRDYQEPVVEKFLNHIQKDKYGGGLLELPCAYGKTCLALNIITHLRKKTFIIVHKEFLLNQWIERIEQFLPKARIGRLQGSIIDIDNKDIVIGMLQSLSMKEYPASIFDSFGFTIIDEVHHISSQTFSNALFKIVTKYALGLSATMERKDGTTHVFKMFLGNVIFKGKREEQMNVHVHAIEYKVDDEEFNEVKFDYRGNPQYSTMITKLCSYNRRSEFILKILSDMLIDNSNQQIMILAHNKSILKYLYDAIEHRKIASVGYYVGGMKEKALKETEGKTVVIATYSMAAEALDIKTLTTLIMATPKTDIEQSIGRILRVKHSNPIVVDIIDGHQLFQNQWRKRKTFYKKENYKIIYTNNEIYTTDTSKWTTLYSPKQMLNNCKEINNSKITKKMETERNVKKKVELKNGEDYDEDQDEDHDQLESKDKYLIGKCLLTFHNKK